MNNCAAASMSMYEFVADKTATHRQWSPIWRNEDTMPLSDETVRLVDEFLLPTKPFDITRIIYHLTRYASSMKNHFHGEKATLKFMPVVKSEVIYQPASKAVCGITHPSLLHRFTLVCCVDCGSYDTCYQVHGYNITSRTPYGDDIWLDFEAVPLGMYICVPTLEIPKMGNLQQRQLSFDELDKRVLYDVKSFVLTGIPSHTENRLSCLTHYGVGAYCMVPTHVFKYMNHNCIQIASHLYDRVPDIKKQNAEPMHALWATVIV